MAKKTAEKATATFTPYQRTKTIPYLEKDAPEGADPFHITMASDLTIEEVESINDVRRAYIEALARKRGAGGDEDEASSADAEVKRLESEFLESLAPFVLAWPEIHDRQGNPIPPPSEGGGQMFKKVPGGILQVVMRDLLDINMGRVDPKS